MPGRGIAWAAALSSIMLITGPVSPTLGVHSLLHAQGCTSENPPCPPDEAPTIGISPGPGPYTSPALTVTVTITDDYALNNGTLQLWLNGGGVGYSWNWTGSANSQASANVTLQSGSNTLTAQVCDNLGQCTTEAANFTYNPLPPPPWQGPPIVSAAPHYGEILDRSRCIASCFDITASYSTPAYFSHDTPRSATLVYSSAVVQPRGVVFLDVTDNSQNPAEKFSLLLRVSGSGGPYVTFTNGSTEVFFSATGGTVRIGAQFDASGLTTGAYDYTAYVRSWWGTSFQEAAGVPVRIIVVNGLIPQPHYGRGWGVLGAQKLHFQSSGVLLTDGDGSAIFFASCGQGCNTYVTPSGDFTQLVKTGTTYERRFPDGSVTRFSSQGQITNVTDRFNNKTTFIYSSGRLWLIRDPTNTAIEFRYEGWGKLDYIISAGRTSQVTIDASNRLVEVFDPDGVRALRAYYSFSNSNLLETVEDRLGAGRIFLLDSTGKLSEYHAPGVTVEGGGLVSPLTKFTSLERAVFVDGTGYGTSWNPAPSQSVATLRAVVIAPIGDSTRFTMDRFRQATSVEYRDPQGQLKTARATFDDQGRLIHSVNAAGGSASYEWSGPRLTRADDHASGTLMTFDHELSYNQVTHAWMNGVLLRQNYFGAFGRLDSTRVGTAVTRFTYDGQGRVLTVRDPQNHQTTIAYGSGLSNTRTVTAPVGGGSPGTTTFSHDSYGRTTSVTDPFNRVVTTVYNSINRITSVTGPNSTTVTYGYNDATRTYTLTDPKSQVYTTVINGAGWVVSETDPRGLAQQYTYDRNGNVKSHTNRRGQVTSFTYDARNRVLTRTADGQTTTFSYDPDNRWVAVSNGESIDTLRLDGDGRPLETISWRAGHRYRIASTYTSEGLRNTYAATYPNGQTRGMMFGYDDLQRLYLVQDPANRSTGIFFDAEHLVSEVRLATSPLMRATNTYTSAHRLASVAFDQGRDPELGRRYWYDGLGRIEFLDRGVQSTGWPLADMVRRQLTYDVLGRLGSYTDTRLWETQEWVCPNPPSEEDCYWENVWNEQTLRSAGYSYDPAGNRTDQGGSTETGNRLSWFAGYAMAYDNDGNLTSKSGGGLSLTLSWNTLGQLTQVVRNGVTTTFGYDGWGRRVRKTSSGVTTRYLWDGDDLVAELDGSGNPLREYGYYPGVDRPHSVRTSDGAIYYYVTEQPGHVVHLVNTSNGVVNSYEYTPWGEPIASTEQVAQPLRFAALQYDTETGLYYVRSRYYDAQVGRFVSEDLIGIAGGLNVYRYVGNNPANTRDPSGLAEWSCPMGWEEVGWDWLPGTDIQIVVCEQFQRAGGGARMFVARRVGGVTVTPGSTFSTPRGQGWSANRGARGSVGQAIYTSLGGRGNYQRELAEQRTEVPACIAAVGGAVFALAQDAFVVAGAIRLAASGSRVIARAWDFRTTVSNTIPIGGHTRAVGQSVGLIAAGYGVGGIGQGIGVEPIFEGGVLRVLETLGGFVPGINFGMSAWRAGQECS